MILTILLLIPQEDLNYIAHTDLIKPLSVLRELLNNCVSDSLILHQVKTKKITAMKEVWIPGVYSHSAFIRAKFYLKVRSPAFEVNFCPKYRTVQTRFPRTSPRMGPFRT